MTYNTSHATSAYIGWVVKPRLNSLKVLRFLVLMYFTANGRRNTHLLLFAKKLNLNSLLMPGSKLLGSSFLLQISGDTFAYAASVVNNIRVGMEEEQYGAILIYC